VDRRQFCNVLLVRLCHFGHTGKGRKLLRKRTIASGGSRASVGKSLRERQRSPQVGRARETCGTPPTSRDRTGVPSTAPVLGWRCVFPPPSSVFAAQWFLARSRQCDKVVTESVSELGTGTDC